MRKKFLIPLWGLLAFYANAQIYYSFNDSSIIPSAFVGDTGKFIVDANGMLRLNDVPYTGFAAVSVASKAIDNAQWEFYVSLAFEPSSGSYVEAHLTSNVSGNNTSWNGYVVRVGGIDREISLFRHDGASETKLIDGRNNRVKLSAPKLRIKVTRDSVGYWTLFSDTTGFNNYFSEGTAIDSTHRSSTWFTLRSLFSSTRANAIAFDDIVITGNAYQDKQPASLYNLKLLTDTTLWLNFSEALDSEILMLNTSIQINQQLTACSWIKETSSSFILKLNEHLPMGYFSLSLDNIYDLDHNKSTFVLDSILHYIPLPGDLVITEILADPSPTIGMPEYEYIELFNASPYPINLTKFKLTSGTYTYFLPTNAVVKSGTYTLLGYKNALNCYDSTINFIPLFTSIYTINNDESFISISDSTGLILDAFTYKSSLHTDNNKKNGGYALEKIKLINPCGAINNWMSSIHILGGSPGNVNSVAYSFVDSISPTIIDLISLADSSAIIYFSEPILPSSINQSTFELDNMALLNWQTDSVANLFTTLYFNTSFSKSKEYTLNVGVYKDCALNNSKLEQHSLIITEKAIANDIIINEILFDAPSGYPEYIELYNSSTKIIDLSSLTIFTRNDSGLIDDETFIQSSVYPIFPNQYLALTKDKAKLCERYSCLYPSNILVLPSLPTFNDDKDRVGLHNNLEIFEYFEYSSSMHAPLIKNPDGISLERINPALPIHYESSWFSASFSSGGGTPGYENSCYQMITETNDKIIIDPIIVSPYLDGHDDYIRISIKPVSIDCYVSISIYNTQGLLISNPINNVLCGNETIYNWNGCNDNGQALSTGIYFIFIYLHAPNGYEYKTSKSVTVVN